MQQDFGGVVTLDFYRGNFIKAIKKAKRQSLNAL
jgi:hypothetical protein